MTKYFCQLLLVLLMSLSSLFAQSKGTAPLVDKSPPVSTLIAVLTSSLESRSATAGQEFALRAVGEVVVDGRVIIPKGSKILGQVTEAVTKAKDQPQSELSLLIEKAVRPDGSEVPLQGIIAALAAPQDTLSDDPTYGMLHSNEPTQRGVSAGGIGSASGALPAASKASSTAAVATANLKGLNERVMLDENSQGCIGYDDLSIAWHLVAPPPTTVISSKGKNVKLKSGTQMLLRMAPPR